MSVDSNAHGLSAHWRGHFFLFGARRAPEYGAASGLRLLLIFVVLEVLVGPRLALFSSLGFTLPPLWLRVPLQLATALLLVRFVAGLPLAQIGLRPWRNWSTTERSYFIQVILLANVVFCVLFADRLRAFFGGPGSFERISAVFLPSFLWGFHQELMYRGILQTELMRRFGALWGIVVANALYTFGPLHFYHFAHTSPALPMFAGICAIGLLFSVLFWRSGNLWIVAVMHGIGDAYIVGTLPQ